MSARHSSDPFQVADSKATEGSETPTHNSIERTFSSESTLPNLEDEIEKAVANQEDDWENDPENARNWSTRKKWTAACIVRRRLLIFFR